MAAAGAASYRGVGAQPFGEEPWGKVGAPFERGLEPANPDAVEAVNDGAGYRKLSR